MLKIAESIEFWADILIQNFSKLIVVGIAFRH